ncbi:MAG: vanomycin resistance protein VanB, partial [Ruminiclostridium sp.]|nr:vanomycin resistance protein VanB [Ruminiclostridium sp.]
MFYSVNSAGKAKTIVIIITSVIIFTVFLMFNLSGDSNKFRKGVKVEGVDVSGLDMAEAKDIVTESLNNKYGKSAFSLNNGEKTYSYAINEISYQFLVNEALIKAFHQGRTGNIFKKTLDVLSLYFNGTNLEIRNDFDKNKLMTILEKIKKDTEREPINASINYKNGNIGIFEDTAGRSMDIDINKELVENYLEKRDFKDIPLRVENIKPDITYAEIKDINAVVSDFHTDFSLSDQNRSHNIRLASSKLDGIILKPDESFSMNETLGPRTAKNGYREAPVIFKNELIPGTGGGICQVTTTLYNTVLKAKLDVLERSPHSMPLAYVQPGQDATIADGVIDFRFRN